ncbi:hypothetical protein PCANC_20884 [Puccinia coronata f. sp. avenae]|uniref:Uncharacterized protein n=1 Tax=Puccinia coronata f. sp. avenae TaxID=200324 RepID=A0A2N5TW84_9BASI|nr:hypothetical protein PCANC_20884 [Puccinia coronata f. sp. avenae]
MNAPIPMIPHEYNFWAMNEKQGMLQQCMEASILKFLSKDCLTPRYFRSHYLKQEGEGWLRTLDVRELGLFLYLLEYARSSTPLGSDNSARTGSERQSTGILDVYQKTYAIDGLAGLSRGRGYPLCR